MLPDSGNFLWKQTKQALNLNLIMKVHTIHECYKFKVYKLNYLKFKHTKGPNEVKSIDRSTTINCCYGVHNNQLLL